MKDTEQKELAALIATIIAQKAENGKSPLPVEINAVVSNKAVLTLDTAKKLLSFGEEKAAAMGVPMVITIADDGGNIKAQHRMDGSLLASIAISAEKAFTAVALRASTKEAAKTILPGQPLYGLQYTHPEKFCLFGGGIPLFYQGCCVGAVGVSGGTMEQDVEAAEWIAARAEELGLR